MITKNEAIKLAKEHNSAYDYCTEYDNVYLFSEKDSLSIGGFSSPIAIMKQTGECFNMTYFIDHIKAGDLIEEGYL